MKIIEKIEIKSFRSFGNRKKQKTLISKIEDLNIFSGANDSGKSNVLRALNLFFNQKTNLTDFINFNNDFFKTNTPDKDDVKEELITIKLTFWNQKNKGVNAKKIDYTRLPEKFWVSRKWLKTSTYTNFQQNDGVHVAFKTEKKKNWKLFYNQDEKTIKTNVRANLSKQLTDFLNSIQYHYVPAIKDKSYFSHLYGELQQTLLKVETSNVNKNKTAFEDAIQISTKDLMREFKKVVNTDILNISAFFELPDLINLFKTLNVQTGNVNLLYRGDGVQAKLIPEILNFIAVKESKFKPSKLKKGDKVKKYFIWGFEEPENSYEYKNAQLLADRFLQLFSRKAQIFITTHSKEFLSTKRHLTNAEEEIYNNKKLNLKLKEEALNRLKPNDVSSGVSIYRVWKNESTNNTSQVTKFDESNNAWEKICDDLGIIQEARIIEGLQEKLAEQTKDIINSNLSIEKQSKIKKALISELKSSLANLEKAKEKIEEYEKPIFYVEDKYDQIYKIAYLKLQGIDCKKDNVDVLFQDNSGFVIRRGEGAGKLAGRLRAPNNDGYEDKKIVGLFDFDREGRENFHCLSKESFWEKDIKGDLRTGYFKTRKDHPCFYALLLPIPSSLEHLTHLAWEHYASYIEVENLLPLDFLKHNNFVTEKTMPGGPYYKMDYRKKHILWKKLFDLPKEHFNHFQPLFDKLDELF